MKLRQIRKPIRLFFLLLLLAALPGCRINVVQDDYSLEQIEGEISCEYRIGEDAKWMEDCVASDVTFDKDHFLALFQEYAAYDPLTGSKDPMQCDLKIRIEEQPEAWQEIRESEFNVRAVFDGGQRNVSLYRYDGKLYFNPGLPENRARGGRRVFRRAAGGDERVLGRDHRGSGGGIRQVCEKGHSSVSLENGLSGGCRSVGSWR